MRTVQMTLDDNLVKTMDKVVRDLHTTRSAFARKAFQQAILKNQIKIAQSLSFTSLYYFLFR